MSGEKRRNSADNKEEEDDNEGWIGPMPSEAAKPKPKKRKGKLVQLVLIYCNGEHIWHVLNNVLSNVSVLEFESLYLENLPSSETYEFSYMHRDVVTHVVVTKTDFVITASQDGHLKFWKKQVYYVNFTISKMNRFFLHPY